MNTFRKPAAKKKGDFSKKPALSKATVSKPPRFGWAKGLVRYTTDAFEPIQVAD